MAEESTLKYNKTFPTALRWAFASHYIGRYVPISLRYSWTGKTKSVLTLKYHSSLVVTHRMLCNWSRIAWLDCRICANSMMGNGPFSLGSSLVSSNKPFSWLSIQIGCRSGQVAKAYPNDTALEIELHGSKLVNIFLQNALSNGW